MHAHIMYSISTPSCKVHVLWACRFDQIPDLIQYCLPVDFSHVVHMYIKIIKTTWLKWSSSKRAKHRKNIEWIKQILTKFQHILLFTKQTTGSVMLALPLFIYFKSCNIHSILIKLTKHVFIFNVVSVHHLVSFINVFQLHF